MTLHRTLRGKPWIGTGRGLEGQHISALLFEPGSGRLFAGCHADDGASWAELDAYADPSDDFWHEVHRLLIHSNDPDLMYLATGLGSYRTRDGGKSFDNVHHRGGRMGYPEFLFLDPTDHATILMGGSRLNPTEWFRDGIADSTILQSRDQADSWTEPNAGFPNPAIGAFEAMSLHLWYGGMMLVIGTATSEGRATDDNCRSWICLDDHVPPVSKEDHHLPFMSDEDRAAAMTERGHRDGLLSPAVNSPARHQSPSGRWRPTRTGCGSRRTGPAQTRCRTRPTGNWPGSYRSARRCG